MNNKKISTRTLALGGLLVAIQLVLSRFLYIMPTQELKITFGGVPIALAGIIFGPLMGSLVGLTSDILGVMINPGGTIHIGFAFTTVLAGLIPGIAKLIFINEKRNMPTLALALSFIIISVFAHIILNTLWLTQLYGTPFNVLLITRIPKSLINDFANFLITRAVYSGLENTPIMANY